MRDTGAGRHPVWDPDVSFAETSATERTAEMALSHLSVELGHLYMDDLDDRTVDLTSYFRRIAAWCSPEQLATLAGVAPQRLRASTCVLIDDYFAPTLNPSEVVPRLVDAAAAAGLHIDYVARESGLAAPLGSLGFSASLDAGLSSTFSLADLVEGLVVADPPAGFNGSRPPLHDNGWLCNGVRSPVAGPVQAMRSPGPWQPPLENRAHRHSIFVDVEVWTGRSPERLWSCPFLAAVWQLLRLGQLRVHGESAVVPAELDLADLPASWAEFPMIGQLSDRPASFSAYRTLSVFDSRFLPVENAVHMILSQVAVDPSVTEQTRRRASREKVPLPEGLPDRVSHVLLGG